MKKILGICAVAAISAGVAIFVKKCLDAGCKDDVLYDDDGDFLGELEELKSSKTDAVFNQATKALDSMKAVVCDLRTAVKDFISKHDTAANENAIAPEQDTPVDDTADNEE